MSQLMLIGNSLSSMIAATLLARRGINVVVVNGSPNWGGHFSSVECGGCLWDAGMVLHEFTAYNIQHDIQSIHTYDSAVRYDAGRFCAVVRDFVHSYQHTSEIAAPAMYVEGQVLPDLLIANQLNALGQLPFASAMQAQLLQLVKAKGVLHASRKHVAPDFQQYSYTEASLANHGSAFHDKVIEPFCRKVLDMDAAAIPALYHRAAWLPLIYPETLLSYLQGEPQRLPATSFSYPVGATVGDLARQLMDEMKKSPRITLIAQHPRAIIAQGDGYRVEFAGHEAVPAQKLAWSSSVGELLKALALPSQVEEFERTSIVLGFLRVPAHDLKMSFSVLNIVESELSIYRVMNQSLCAGEDSAFVRLVVEANAARLPVDGGKDGVNWGDAMVEDLLRASILRSGVAVERAGIRKMTNSLMRPTFVNERAWARESAVVREVAPQIELLGPASGFFTSSFNDQVVQALKLDATWGSA
jgi:hypothetical protein